MGKLPTWRSIVEARAASAATGGESSRCMTFVPSYTLRYIKQLTFRYID